MKNLFSKLHKIPWIPICLIILVIIFFSIRLVITYDGAHYLNYVAIFESELPASSWDIVRGPVFPSIIFLFDLIFGKTGTGILIGAFLFYLIFTVVCYKTCKEIFNNVKHAKLFQNIILCILILNPLILGYFHVLLTEFIIITFTLLNIFLAYRWIYCNIYSKKRLVLYSLYFIFSVIFCYHLKQPYIVVSFTPIIVAAIISIFQKCSLKNVLYRIGTIFISLVFLFFSIISWNKILNIMGADTATGRNSSSIFSRQLLQTYQITYDQDGDGQNDLLPIQDTIGVLFNNFISDPTRILKIYISNYCGLSSICIINSNDGVNYNASFQFSGNEIFENAIIGYRPYNNISNLFNMPEHLRDKAIQYGESSNRSLIARIINIFNIPTNLLFKLSIFLCLPALILLIIIKIKNKTNKNPSLFYLSAILLITSFAHLAISAGVGLIIDRYAIGVFAPSILGISGTIIYTKSFFSRSSSITTRQTKIKKVSRNAKT